MIERVINSGVGKKIAMRYRIRAKPSRVVIHGISLDVDRSWFDGLLNGLYRGTYEVPEVAVLRQTLHQGDVYFELGASIGVLMTIACGIVGDRNVTAVEADPTLVRIAQHTAEINGFHPTVINAILGDDEVAHRFFVRSDFWESSLIPQEGAREIMVPGRLFAHELEKSGATYLMVDIEGGELNLLREPLPSTIRAVCLEVHPDRVGDNAVQDLLQHLMSQGFILDTRLAAPQVVFFSRHPTQPTS